MDTADAVRQVEEILSLQDKWYSDAVEVKTPALFSRLKRSMTTSSRRVLEVKKCLTIHVNCAILHPEELPDLLLAFDFPFNYPSQSSCRVKALHASDPSCEYSQCSVAMEQYLQSFQGCECVELALEWLAEHKCSCTKEEDDNNHNDSNDGVPCYILRYNHLLSGPEHKKEKSMLDAARKSKLQGGLLWGTPGVVVVVPPSTLDDAKEYAMECRTIGKRPGGVDEIRLPLAGIDEAGLGGLAQQKRGGKLQELDTAALRVACGGNEDVLRTVFGLQ